VAVKLHRCGTMWVKGPHPCWQVQKALDEAGVDYEVVKHPWLPRSRRTDLQALSGQKMLPVLELEDGRIVREESKDLVARVRDGRLEAAS
jgi:hypothetical protein